MAEQIQDDQTETNVKETLKIKRTGQTCITFFVVFVICLISFGKTPLVKIVGKDGYSVNFDFPSCLGIAMGVFALIFLLLNFRKVMELSKARKILGLIGCTGLILHAALAIFMPLSYGAGENQTPNNPLAINGAEQWVIDGKTYNIELTCYLRLGEGLQYTIEYPYQFTQADANMDNQRALDIAFPLMKHAYTNDLHSRITITKIGDGKLTPSRIGVVLYETGAGKAQGYRVALSLDQRSGNESRRNQQKLLRCHNNSQVSRTSRQLQGSVQEFRYNRHRRMVVHSLTFDCLPVTKNTLARSWSPPLLAAADIESRDSGAFIAITSLEVDIDAIGAPNRLKIGTGNAVVVPLDSTTW